MKPVATADVASYRELGHNVSNDPTHPLHRIPNVPAGARRILDVGCHAGHTLEALRLPEDCEVFGCDINTEALELARKCLPYATFAPARAEELPFEDSYFDFVSPVAQSSHSRYRKPCASSTVYLSPEENSGSHYTAGKTSVGF